MKQKLLNIGIWIGIMIFIITIIPNAHANNTSPVRMKLIYGYDDMELLETKDRIYISAYDEIIFDELMMYHIGDKIYQFDSLYEAFIVEDVNTGEILYEKIGRDSIVFDAYKYNEGIPISFSSNGETVIIEEFTSFKMYFIKENEFSKPSVDLRLVVNVDNPLDIEELNSLFGAWDNYNGNITDSIVVIADNYSQNMYITGFYTVTIEASDESGNKISFTYTVWVKDDESPIVEPLNDIEVSYTEVIDIESLLEHVVATDNYTESLGISINDENYMGNEHLVGEYFVEFMIDDYNGNAVTIRQKITVIDDVPPVITGKFYHYFEVEQFIRPNDLVYPMNATDEIDKDPIKVYLISMDYVKYTVGEFTAVLGAKDRYGNEATVIIIIQVNDSKPPEFFIKIPQINIVDNQVYDAAELLGLIKELLTINYTDIEITKNEYIGNEQRPGVYQVTLSANTGTEWIRIQTQIRVNESIPVQTDVNNIGTNNYWQLISLILTMIVLLISISVIIIRKRKKSIILK